MFLQAQYEPLQISTKHSIPRVDSLMGSAEVVMSWNLWGTAVSNVQRDQQSSISCSTDPVSRNGCEEFQSFETPHLIYLFVWHQTRRCWAVWDCESSDNMWQSKDQRISNSNSFGMCWT
jgi:hypothetical protein